MTIEFKGTAEQNEAKLQRIIRDLEAANGAEFDKDKDGHSVVTMANVETALNRALDSRGLPHGDEKQAMESLHTAALDQTLGEKHAALARELQRDLFYMGYTKSPGPPETDGNEGPAVKDCETAIAAFLDAHKSDHPEYASLPVKDLFAKITDDMWSGKRGPYVAVNVKEYGGTITPMYGGEGAPAMPIDGLYTDYDKAIGEQVRGTAEATFADVGGVRAIQAQLYVLDPRNNRPPDGHWTMQDQEALQKYLAKSNSGIKPEDLVQMRWDNRKELGARISAVLTNDLVSAAAKTRHDVEADPTRLLHIATTASGESNPADIQKMQLYLRLENCYDNPNTMPTGKWTLDDQRAMQKYLDQHKDGTGFFHLLDHKNHLPEKAAGMSGADFEKVLNFAAEDARQHKGMDASVFAANSDQNSAVLPTYAVPVPGATPPAPPKQETPPSTPPTPPVTPPATPPAEAEKKPLPKAADEKPLPQNTKTSKIADNGVGESQARLFLMGYGADVPIDGTHASLDAMLTKYAESKGIIKKGDKLEGDNHKKAFDQMNAEWETFAQAHPATFKEVVDKGAAIRDNHDNNKDVLQMQTVLLAMGGKFNRYGLDGKNWNETRGAIDATSSPDGQLGKLLAPYKIENSPWYKPGPATPPAAVTPGPGTTPPKTDAPPAVTPPARKIENVWDDPVDDPFGGDGGFIKPVAAPPAPAVSADQTATPQRRPQDDFSRANSGGPPQPPAGAPPPQTDNGTLPPRGQMSSYFNANAQSDRGSATRFFSALTAPYVYDSPRSQGTELIPAPLGGEHGNQGVVFVIGPDRHFATVYNVNGNFDPRTGQYFDPATHATFDPKNGNNYANRPGMPTTTYTGKVYDLQNPDENQKFWHDVEKAEKRSQDRMNDPGYSSGPIIATPPVIVRPPIFFPRPVYGPPIYGGPGGVNVDVEIGGGRRR